MVIFEILHRFAVPQSGIAFKSPNCGTPPNGRINNCSTGSDGRILAFSVTQRSFDSSRFTRSLCADRRGFLDHLRPKIFFKNVRHSWCNSFHLIYPFNVERLLIFLTLWFY